MATQHTIGGRVFEWSMPGVIRRIEVVATGTDIRAWAAAWAAGLHPSHLKREGLAGLSLAELAERWPDHIADATGDRWSMEQYVTAAVACFVEVSNRFHAEMGADAVDDAEGNSQGDEGGPSALESAPETMEAAGVT